MNGADAIGQRALIDGPVMASLAARYGTPLFVFSEARIIENIGRIRDASRLIDGRLKICYAAKANSLLGVLGGVRRAGCDIEVNSGGELWKALRAGFTGEQIIFNGTSKEPWELEMAIEAGIYAIQVDSLYELSLLADTALRLGRRANVSLRLVPGIESATHHGLRTALLTSKFGMMPDEAVGAFAAYKDSPHLDLCGIHIHIGSQNPDPSLYSDAIKVLFDTMLRVSRDNGIRLKHLNLGGGFPVDHVREFDPQIEHEQMAVMSAEFDPASAIADAWETLTETASVANAAGLLDGRTLLVEPGRSIIADAGMCLTTVRNKKSRPVAGAAATDDWLLTDAGFNILLSMETYKWYYHLVSASRSAEPHDTPYKVAGPLCDGGDVYFDIEGLGRLPDHRMLPQDVQPGEVLALLNCGAYSLSQASQYNGRPLPAAVLIRSDGTPELIRSRDTFEDLANNEVV